MPASDTSATASPACMRAHQARARFFRIVFVIGNERGPASLLFTPSFASSPPVTRVSSQAMTAAPPRTSSAARDIAEIADRCGHQ